MDLSIDRYLSISWYPCISLYLSLSPFSISLDLLSPLYLSPSFFPLSPLPHSLDLSLSPPLSSISLWISRSSYRSLSPSLYLSRSLLSLSLSLHLFPSPSPSSSLSIVLSPSLNLSICLYLRLSTSLDLYRSIPLSLDTSIYPSPSISPPAPVPLPLSIPLSLDTSISLPFSIYRSPLSPLYLSPIFLHRSFLSLPTPPISRSPSLSPMPLHLFLSPSPSRSLSIFLSPSLDLS